MTGVLTNDATSVPIANGQDVEITPGKPWPSTYRGSRYSIVDSKNHGTVLEWRYEDLVVHAEPPSGLVDRLKTLGKSRGSGRGSIRITAGGEVLTKIHSSLYTYRDQAPVESGWIPVYLGRLDGDLGFDIDLDPDGIQGDLDVWGGFPFNHGETWAVCYNSKLIWKWEDYRFESAFDHPELVAAYEDYRNPAGRLYINEFGHVIINVPRKEIAPGQREKVRSVFSDWKASAERRGDTAALRLVNRRLKVTGGDNPREGHLPLYLGHLTEFDDGLVPKPVADDEGYYLAASRDESRGY